LGSIAEDPAIHALYFIQVMPSRSSIVKGRESMVKSHDLLDGIG
jgi:hypothetical protein